MVQVQAKKPEEKKEEQEKEDCVFCKIVRGEIDTEFIEESENFIAFPDANPKTEGHTLIIPKKHFSNLLDLPSDLAGEMIDLIKEVARKKLDKGFEGFNIAVNNGQSAGQVVKHLHIHLLPRKKQDDFSWRL